MKSNLTNRLSNSISGVTENNNRKIASFHNDRSLMRRVEAKTNEEEIVIPEVEDAMEEIKK